MNPALFVRALTRWSVIGLLAAISIQVQAQDILMADFEETGYGWIPGGAWTATGTAFGPGPAQGTLANQNPVTGYLGNGLVNTFFDGDASTGTLTSPLFVIQRAYIKFLIGAGNHRGQTCLNLLINGQVVRSAVGMGDLEALGWLEWNVSAWTNQTAQLQIVDYYTGGWGHINVDQIIQTDAALPNLILASQHYLNFPVSYTATNHLVELIQNGLVVHEINMPLVTNGTPDYYAFLDLTAFQGETLVRVDSQPADSNQLAAFIQSSNIITAVPIYQEALRPVYHYTARRGWLNDPNGMVYDNGQYHLYYQHNPYYTLWDNMHWGHAVSADLVHWQEKPEALYPDYLGAMWSGSAVVDSNNVAGFGTNALVAFYTAAGGHSNNPRMSLGQLFTQCLAYSLDEGMTWTKYTNNPIIQNLVGGDNRDPKVIWYAPGNQWVMVFWLNNNDFGFFSSPDLLHWTQNSTFTFPGVIEVPELFPLPLDGDANHLLWVFWAGAGHYYVGQFDGKSFTPQAGPYLIRQGNSMAAAQTFNNIPATDGRRILISQGTVSFPNMPFNSTMNFPVNLTLQTSPAGPWLYANPVKEIASLRTTTNQWAAQPLASGVNILSNVSGEAFEMDAQFQLGTNQITITVAGTQVIYNGQSQQVSCEGLSNALVPSNNWVELHLLVDRGSIEILGNGGQLYMPMSLTPVAGAQPLGLAASGNGATLLSLSLYNLGSAWPAAPPFIATQPAFPGAVSLGGAAALSVTAYGTTIPLFYQWFSNGQAVAGATNSTLSIFPVSTTNANFYVVVSNGGGSVTSSVAALSVLPPCQIAYWRMESQIEAPNNLGVPTWPGIADSHANVGQGIHDLIMFNGLPGQPVTLSTNVAPASMFVNGHAGGNHSYNAEAITNVDGCLFYPQDQYGDEMDFTGAFSIELYFKTDGDQSNAGIMELFCQGSDVDGFPAAHFRYGIDLNEAGAGAGAARFAVANSRLAQTNVVDLTNANYADGQWHYLLAVCDSTSGTNGQMRLTIVNQNASEASATNNLPAGFLPLPAEDDGNAFVGRYNYPDAADGGIPRTFLGYIDEVQITSGVVPDTWRVGKVPSLDNFPHISWVAAGSNGVNFQWTGAAASQFVVQWVPRLGADWQTIATLPSLNSLDTFTDTNAMRLTNAASFYRILAE